MIVVLLTVVALCAGAVMPAQASTDPDKASLQYRQEHQNELYDPSTNAKQLYNELAASATVIGITPNNNAMTLANALVVPGSGITVTSASYTGAATAAGLFTGGPFGINNGIILASGDVINALPPDASGATTTDFGLPGCADCDFLIPGFVSFDAAILEINFDVSPACSAITFDFVFGTEEYPEWVGSAYNDVYGAFLNGVQISHDGTGAPITVNGPFFSGGWIQLPPGNGMEYDGSTLKLKTTSPIVPGSTGNTIIFVICDAGDHILDSGVLLADLECTGDADTCTGVPPSFDHPPTPGCNGIMNVNIGQTISFAVQASDPGPNNDIVVLTAAGLPAGATMTPALPTSGNPVSSTFSWTPSASDVGSHLITFVATDSEPCALSDQCKITIVVGSGAIPTLTEWGMIIMFVIMAAGVIWFVVRNRRRMATA